MPNCWPEENLGRLIKYVPVKDEDVLLIYWALPNYEKQWKSKPLYYFQFLLGHEGENSLLSYLISEGLAQSLCCYHYIHLHAISNLVVSVDLTKKGLENYDTVIEAVFQYLNNLKEPQEYVFEEYRKIGEMTFQF